MLNDYQIESLSLHKFDPLYKFDPLITPYNKENLNPHSYDLTLGNNFKVANPLANAVVDLREDKSYRFQNVNVKDGGHIYIASMQGMLAHTKETINVPSDCTAMVCGKSSIARNLVQVEAAGLCDAGFHGEVTLELFNMSPWPLLLTVGMRICQVTFTISDKAEFGDYSVKGHYCNQTGARLPAYYL